MAVLGVGGNAAAVAPMVPLDQLHAPVAPGAVAMVGQHDGTHGWWTQSNIPAAHRPLAVS